MQTQTELLPTRPVLPWVVVISGGVDKLLLEQGMQTQTELLSSRPVLPWVCCDFWCSLQDFLLAGHADTDRTTTYNTCLSLGLL